MRQIRLALGDGECVYTTVHVLRGEQSILRLQSLLVSFSDRCGIPSGTLLDLPYFLQKPGLLRRIPYLLLFSTRAGVAPTELQPQDLLGTVLLLEYNVLGVGLRAFATNDRSGSGTLLAVPEHRMPVAAAACELLITHGAWVIMLSFVGLHGAEATPAFQRSFNPLGRLRWAVHRRHAPAYLPLKDDLDSTLAQLGQKTRSNMRYYRRKAERDLGCAVVPHVEADDAELLRFNRECMYPVDDETLRWRLSVLHALRQPFLMGMKDAGGRWLSIVAGRRFGDTAEILWQLNRSGYSGHSFSTVMRSHCMEQEIARGTGRLQVEGGTFHTMHHSFQKEEITDFVVLRPLARPVLRMLVNRFVPSDNSLADMLKTRELRWYRR